MFHCLFVRTYRDMYLIYRYQLIFCDLLYTETEIHFFRYDLTGGVSFQIVFLKYTELRLLDGRPWVSENRVCYEIFLHCSSIVMNAFVN